MNGFWGATGYYESWEVRVDDTSVVFKHFWDPGKDPNRTITPHLKFLAGDGNDEVAHHMGGQVLDEVRRYVAERVVGPRPSSS